MSEDRKFPNKPVAERGIDGYLGAGNLIFEVKGSIRAVRSLRASILSVAYALDKSPTKEAYLVLVDPGISEVRLRTEWEAALHALSEPVRLRLRLIIVRDGHYSGIPDSPNKRIERYVAARLAKEKAPGTRLPRPDYFFVVLKILVNHWLCIGGPLTTRWLMETAGCSYPTVAEALKRLGQVIKRHSDRRVELDRFPREAWRQLLALSDNARATTRFVDRSGQPRSPDVLLRRLKQMHRPDIAVGGSLGARHWDPDLDLVGNPRLDLSIHCPGDRLDLDFASRLDPALVKSENAKEPSPLVIHVVREATPMFELSSDGVNWASAAECLMDLHELHLEPQALEFLRFFTASRENK